MIEARIKINEFAYRDAVQRATDASAGNIDGKQLIQFALENIFGIENVSVERINGYSTKIEGQELNFDLIKKLMPGDILLVTWFGKMYSSDDPNAYHSYLVVKSTYYPRDLHKPGTERVELLLGPVGLSNPHTEIGRQYLDGGSGSDIIKRHAEPNFPRRYYLLGHVEQREWKPFTPKPGDPGYDPM